MESNTSTLPPQLESSPVEPRKPVPAPRRGGGGFAMLCALAAVGLAGYTTWRVENLQRRDSSQQSEQLTRLEDRLEQALVDEGQLRKDVDALRSRWRDVDTVNKGIREEMLALAQRSRHLDEAIANLAEQRLSGRDALALNEAEFLLLLGQERYQLFGEAESAAKAFQLADSALAASEDPVFASVRLTIAAEVKALQDLQASTAAAVPAALGKLRDAAPDWPVRNSMAVPEAGGSRFARVFASFIRIRRDSDGLGQRDPGLSRSLVAIDLQAASAAWQARDGETYRRALSRAATEIAAAFDGDDGRVGEALAEIERLKAIPLAPPLPVLGTALGELRDLRANRALSRNAVPAPAAAESDTDDTAPSSEGTGDAPTDGDAAVEGAAT